LQGTYTAYSRKHDISDAAVVLFALACGQIMYAFTMCPDTLSRSYKNWIMGAAGQCKDGVQLNYHAVREHALDVPALDRILARADTTPANRAALVALRAAAAIAPPRYAPCAAMHPAISSCLTFPLVRFADVFRRMLPFQAALHLLPSILLRWRVFHTHPARALLHAALGSARSSAFLGVLAVLYQSTTCVKTQLHARLVGGRLPPGFVELLVSPGSFWVPGFVAGLALLVEEPRRRAAVALYVMPKGFVSAWTALHGQELAQN
ncbi:hypothetical protein FB451DRAFT_1027891, partial [Mycena latifolia]